MKQAAEAGWTTCAQQLREHDDAMVRAWKEEIDTLLVFAGLFSAALTAFNVELYTALTPDPGTDLTNQILSQISAQLAVLSFNGSNFHSVQPSFPQSEVSNRPGPSAGKVWINALWFSALVSSLSAAAIAIIVRQWLNYFISPTSSDPRRSVEVRCLRYNLGLLAWRVPEILSILPVLLLTSLVLFLAGLMVLLWSLNRVVASITTALISILFLFFVVTTIAPATYADCPYKSPQALMMLWVIQRISCIWSTHVYDNWRAQEQAIWGGVYAFDLLRRFVTTHALSHAHETLSDSSFLTTILRPCVADPSYSIHHARRNLQHIIKHSTTRHVGRGIGSAIAATFAGVVSQSSANYSAAINALLEPVKAYINSQLVLDIVDAQPVFVACAQACKFGTSDPNTDWEVADVLSSLVRRVRVPFAWEGTALPHKSE
ncbi:hypothetical protein OBBRIDRAFT_838282 [Obba rivulosa]|uniref:DUF6535 domain-containing protein n=1 Tax=Obba rivulosa TaxID=1052685 RepID=A0A8E2DFS8_9APHY|nr:hypothetical protein OBBRIDRAFT_838282 [Obba rivulosa]